jgi:hypothetical protein
MLRMAESNMKDEKKPKLDSTRTPEQRLKAFKNS